MSFPQSPALEDSLRGLVTNFGYCLTMRRDVILPHKTEHGLFMQVLKSDIKSGILDAAKHEFAKKGFLKASMRDIAARVGVGVGNLYNYFPSKDSLFVAVLAPITTAFYAMFDRHHGSDGADALEMVTADYLKSTVAEYVNIISGNRTLMKILFFKAQGSSLENFKMDFTDRATEQVKLWFADNKVRHPYINTNVSDFMIHLHTVWMFTMFEEMLMHEMNMTEIRRMIEEYIKFETCGWKHILQI